MGSTQRVCSTSGGRKPCIICPRCVLAVYLLKKRILFAAVGCLRVCVSEQICTTESSRAHCLANFLITTTRQYCCFLSSTGIRTDGHIFCKSGALHNRALLRSLCLILPRYWLVKMHVAAAFARRLVAPSASCRCRIRYAGSLHAQWRLRSCCMT